MTRCLALDLATYTGYAFGIFGKKPMSGLIKLPSREWRPVRAAILEGQIRDLIEANKAELVIIEDVYAMIGPKFSMDQQKLLHSYRCATEMACYKSGMQEQHLLTVHPDQWRKSFGTNDVPKHIRDKNKSQPGAIRKWKKEEAFRRCLELGWNPKDDNQADALGIWAYAESLYEPATGLSRVGLFATATL